MFIKQENKMAVRFLIVGVLNTIVGYGVYALLLYFSWHFSLASLVSQIVGTIHSYFWNKFFTFKSKKYSVSEMVRFIIVYAVSYLVNLAALFVLIDSLKINKFIAGLGSLFITTIISFFGHRYFSFKKNELAKN